MAFQIALPLLLLLSFTSTLSTAYDRQGVRFKPEAEKDLKTSPSIQTSTFDNYTAFPLPVTSHGVYWWIYSPRQMKKYGGDFRVLPYVMSKSLPLDPKRIWPDVALKNIGDLNWNETLDKNQQFHPRVKEYLKDWYTTLVEILEGPDSKTMLDYFSNDKYFTYIESSSDVQTIIRDRARLSAKYNSWRPRPSYIQPSKFSNPLESSTPAPNPQVEISEEDYPMDYDSEDCSEDDDDDDDDEEEESAPSFLNRVLSDTLAGAREFEGRAVNFFYRMAMTTYLSDEEKAKDAIKCILGLDCGVPSFIKSMLQEQGLSILVYGACTPGACAEETEEIARTFRDQLADTYPEIFNATLNLIRELGTQGHLTEAVGTELPE